MRKLLRPQKVFSRLVIKLRLITPLSGSTLDWIGLYPKGITPGSQASIVWSYVPNTGSGKAQITIPTTSSPGSYKVVYLCCDVYTVYDSISIQVISDLPEIELSKQGSYPRYSIDVYLDHLYSSQDSIGIWAKGRSPLKGDPAIEKVAISGFPSDTFSYSLPGNLSKGDHYVHILAEGKHSTDSAWIYISNPYFNIQKTSFHSGEPLIATVAGVFDSTDYIAICPAGGPS